MKTFRIPLQVVFYKEEDRWVAHCLQFDLCGDGATQEEALKRLNGAIETQVFASLEFNNPANLFSPADGKFFEMFAAGKNIAVGEMRFNFPSLVIDQTETRQYQDDENNAEEPMLA